jgi:3-deoxy-D-manno-octulosonic-acid transferase
MVASIGLKLYNLGQRREAGNEAERPLRPAGPLAWLHVPSEALSGPMFALARRLIEDDGVAVMMTCPQPLVGRAGVILQPPPGETPADAKGFLDYWRPEIGVLSDGELRPALLHQVAERKIPLLMVNARGPRFLRDRDGWYPGLMRSALSAFKQILAVDEAGAKLFRKAGAPLSAVAVTGRTEEESVVLPCLERERATLADLLAARPVWFAAGLPATEEAVVLRAHRVALQHSHRLLLILAPDDPAQAADRARRLEETDGWVVAQRAREEEPDPAVEIFVVDNPADYGLWYRLAPVTFLGGSLTGPGPTRDPMEAAALGSAIIHGPKTGRHGLVFGRLGAARATRAVASATDLSDALGELLAPDRAARLAQSAWAVASDGAEVTELVLDRIRALMDGDG